MKLLPKIALSLGLTLWGAIHSNATEQSTSKHGSSLKIEVGAGSRNQVPLVLIAGINYHSLTFRLQGMGMYFGKYDYWTGVRGSLLWNFFGDLPFNFDVGIGGGYEFAEAPNKMHQAINTANKKTCAYPFNYKEEMDVSAEIWAHLYGFYTQVSVPFHQFRKHDTKSILWGTGFIYSF